MKWFRHFSNASMSADLVALESQFGLEGYARWWKLLEIVALQMDKTDRYSVTLPWSKWESYLSGKRKLLLSYLLATEKLGLTQVIANGELIEIKIPKLALYRDEYSRKSGQTPKKLRTVDTETDTEADKPPIVPPPGDALPTVPKRRERKSEFTAAELYRFTEWYKAYPLKEAPAAAEKAWAKLTKRPDFGDAFVDSLIDAIGYAKAHSPKWRDRIIPHPATWLNQRRWEDEFGATGQSSSMPALASGVQSPARTTPEPLATVALREWTARSMADQGHFPSYLEALKDVNTWPVERLETERERWIA